MNRRDFLGLSIGSLTIYCLAPLGACNHNTEHRAEEVRFGVSGRPEPPVEADERTALIWIETGVCTGCGCSLLDSFAPPSETLLPDLCIAFQETLSGAFGTRAIDQLVATARAQSGRFLLVVDGAIPTGVAARMTTLGAGTQGIEYTAEALVAELAAQAGRVVALGTCACFGGIPGSAPNTGAHVSVAEVIHAIPIRIPGCPPNPSWIVGALTALLRGDPVELDLLGRPTLYFANTIHDVCPRRERFEAKDFAVAPGDPERCLLHVGCKGPIARGDCSSRLWQGRSYCIKANHPCIGCTSPSFLDSRPTIDGNAVGDEGRAATPFYRALEV